MIYTAEALTGKHILVTGGSSGIGLAAATRMAQCGATITLLGRDDVKLNLAIESLPSGRHFQISSDIGNFDSAYDAVIRASNEAGPLSGIFHSAGAVSVRGAKMYSTKHVEAVFGSSIMAALGIAKAVAKADIVTDKASILFMSSVSSVRGRAGMGVYAAAKAGIGGLMRALSVEWAARGIRVNELLAGAVATPMHETLIQNLSERTIEEYESLHPLGFGKPNDIGDLATFLMTDASEWITGAAIAVDGGYAAK